MLKDITILIIMLSSVIREKEYQKKYHKKYYKENQAKLNKMRNICNFKKKYGHLNIPVEYIDDFKKHKSQYLKLNQLNTKIVSVMLGFTEP
jgi:hypothetical protein